MTQQERVATHNERVATTIREAKAARGFAVTTANTAVTHAATGVTVGHSGFNHPRSLCQNNTPRFYHALVNDQAAEVTCKRCLAGLAKRGVAA